MEGPQRGPMVRIVSVSSIGWHLHGSKRRRKGGRRGQLEVEGREGGGIDALQSFETIERESPKYVGMKSIALVEPEMLDKRSINLYSSQFLVRWHPENEL